MFLAGGLHEHPLTATTFPIQLACCTAVPMAIGKSELNYHSGYVVKQLGPV